MQTHPEEQISINKIRLNVAVAAILTLLAAWMTTADFSHSGDLIFQTSASVMLACLFVSLLFMVALVMAVLPKRMVIGANLLILSRCALGFPLSVWMDHSLACRIESVALLVLSLAYLALSLGRMMGVGSRPWLDLRHTLVTFASWILIGILTIPVWVLGYAYGVRNLIGDYLSLTSQGVGLMERVFEKDGQKIHLVGMMHIGDGVYYNDLTKRMAAEPAAAGRRLILTEGVADRDGIIPADFANGKTYERWAKALGLVVQKKLEPTARNHPGPPAPAPAVAVSPEPPLHPTIVWRNADIDVSDLSAPHRQRLVSLLEAASSANLSQLLISDMGGITGPQLEDLLKNGLIITRNDALMKRLDDMGPGFSEIYIPWGAAHLPDIEQRLLARGYSKTAEVTRPVLAFRKGVGAQP